MKRIEYKYNDLMANGNIFLFEIEPYVKPNGGKERKARFLCHCGKEFESQITPVKIGTTKSCGCAFKDINRKHPIGFDFGRRHYRTKKGILTRIYFRQKSSSVQRKHSPPDYTLSELREYAYSLPLFHSIYDSWVKSGYAKYSTPSFDRIDDYKGYALDNIQIMTWKDNLLKSFSDRKNGINNKLSKAVNQIDMHGTVVNTYYSLSQAYRETGIGNINVCCKDENRTSGGYMWRYA